MKPESHDRREKDKMKDKKKRMTEKDLVRFRKYLLERENSPATIEKYMRDVRKFYGFSETGEISKEQLLKYKEWLVTEYAVSSANSMLVALNQFLCFMELGSLKLKRLREQKTCVEMSGRALSKKEFRNLVCMARQRGRIQLAIILETMCATGVRVSELKYFRVKDVAKGIVRVWNKGKERMVVIPDLLRKKLLLYIKKEQLTSGLLFCTRSGREKDRSNIWREMKELAGWANVNAEKVFPHNLRHLFARTFYQETKNLINLSDILGHSSIEVTRIYASEGLNEWKRDMEKMNLLDVTT